MNRRVQITSPNPNISGGLERRQHRNGSAQASVRNKKESFSAKRHRPELKPIQEVPISSKNGRKRRSPYCDSIVMISMAQALFVLSFLQCQPSINEESRLAGVLPSRRSLQRNSHGKLPPLPSQAAEADYGDFHFSINPRQRYLLERLPPLQSKMGEVDYGEIDFSTLSLSPRFRRLIDPKDEIEFEKYRESALENMNDLDHEWDSKDDPSENSCAPPTFVGSHFFTCNSFHEVNFALPFDDRHMKDQDHRVNLLSHGYYRDAWLLRPGNSRTSFVVKRTRYNDRRLFDYRDYQNTDHDALVMERLSASPYVMDIYGYCGGSVAVEAMEMPVKEEVLLDGHGLLTGRSYPSKTAKLEVPAQNSLKPAEKLKMALQMAQGIASLHGNEEGVIVHGDVATDQWMMNSRGQVKVGDFNRAEFLDWDRKKGGYCPFYFGTVYGGRRSPEEMAKKDLTETIDVFALGNTLYSVLTGLRPFYQHYTPTPMPDKFIQSEIVKGKVPVINHHHTRTPGEASLAEIIRICWTYDPKERADAFEIVRLLENAVLEHGGRRGRRRGTSTTKTQN